MKSYESSLGASKMRAEGLQLNTNTSEVKCAHLGHGRGYSTKHTELHVAWEFLPGDASCFDLGIIYDENLCGLVMFLILLSPNL